MVLTCWDFFATNTSTGVWSWKSNMAKSPSAWSSTEQATAAAAHISAEIDDGRVPETSSGPHLHE